VFKLEPCTLLVIASRRMILLEKNKYRRSSCVVKLMVDELDPWELAQPSVAVAERDKQTR
jgi:hypothetical protein